MDRLTLLRRAGEAGLAVTTDGYKRVIRGSKHAEPVARLLIENKSAIMAALADWRARHHEALAYWGTLYPAAEAERLAWGEIIAAWHKRLGPRWPEWQCAGCHAPIGGLPALELADGNRVHLEKLDCLFSFGERWRGEATAGLRALGLDPPIESVE